MLIKGLYTVQNLEKNEQGVQAKVKIHKEHEVFKGHFPDSPVMPGVCMIQMIKELTERTLNQTLFLKKASNVKFMAIIDPEVNSVIDLRLTITSNDDIVNVKNVTSYNDTVALKLNATFKIVS